MSTEWAHGWSRQLLATLEAVFATFVPESEAGQTARHATLAAETLDAVADHGELRLLKLALRSLEVPAANALLAGVPRRFSKADRDDRERILRRWSTHPIPRLRTAYQALKRLALFLAFGDGGEVSPPANGHWARVGYRPAPPVAPSHDSLPVRRLERASDLEADAVVIGSGAGGGVAAARLAAAGLRVVVVEAGGYRSGLDMPRVEADAFRDLYLDRGTTATADLAISILAGGSLGGGTTINWTTSIAPPDAIRREWASIHGLAGFDGPQTDDALARLRVELGLCAPSVIPAKDRLILDGAAALGWEAAPTERNAGPCVDCGACGFGCPGGAKRSGLRVHLADAVKGGAELLVGVRVDRVEIAGGRAVGISGRVATQDRFARVRVRAPRVVVAAGALRTPLLLERSGITHPLLGRMLRLHPVVAVAALMDDPVEMWIGPTQAARSLQFARPGSAAGTTPAHGGFVIESAPAHPGLVASALPWAGGEQELTRMAVVRREAPLIGIVRDTGSGRVRWSRGGHPRIEYRLSRTDAASARRALVELTRLARAGGAREVTVLATPATRWDGDPGTFDAFLGQIVGMSTAPNRVTLFSAHQMGTARAGVDARLYPCDPWGHVRASASGRIVDGLWVADASLFPSASGVNPMLTVMALADRTAGAILA